MKKLYTSISIAIFGISISFGQIQQNSITPKVGEPSTAISVLPNKGFSPQSAFLLMELDKIKKENRTVQNTDSTLIEKYNLFNIGNELLVNTFLLVNEEFDKANFESKGGLINSTSKGIVTASIPVNSLSEIIEVEGIFFVQIAEKVVRNMDEARASTWVDWVHQGNQLPQAYFGVGVVVGIIDGGFDYTHPNFFDGTGSNNYRVKRVWEQNATNGTPPAGFSYGRELNTQTSILNAQRDVLNNSHGTHVAGISAGAGGGVNTTYMGVAPQSELVFVSTNMTDLGIADGIAYILNYASSQNKPCVINMSLGKHIGPHDGFSAFDQYCDGLVGNGKILVGSAGNAGADPLHISKTYTSSSNTLYSFVQFPNTSNGTNGQTVIDIWGNPNQNYEVAVNIYNTNTNSFEDYTPYIQANSNNTYNYILNDDDTFFPDACNVTMSASTYPSNNKSNVQVVIDHTAQDDNYRWAIIEIIATTGKTNMWAATGGAQFTNYGYSSPFQNGSTSSTVGEVGGTGNSIISVGAYNTNMTQVGNIAPFSSKGPTADNRTKPDITAPGNRISASVSRFDDYYLNGGGGWSDVVSGSSNGTNNWYFAQMQGTSMASPMVAGILALWLEAYPNLTHAQALQLLKDNAWTDSYTGTIPSTGNNTWGWGKVDAHEGLLDLLTKIPAQPIINPSGNVAFCQGQNATLLAPNGFSAYQWSNSATSQNITVSTGGNYSVRVTNSQGYISPWSAPKVVTVHQNPATPNISTNGNILTSSATNGNQWYFNGNLISGAAQQNYTAQQNGNYHVVVTNANDCSAQSNTLAFTTVGIADLEEVGVTSVYPNPTNGLLNIQFSENEQDVLLEIIDVSGRVHIQKRVITISQNNVETLNLDNLTTGVYSLRILTNENQATFRIVVAK